MSSDPDQTGRKIGRRGFSAQSDFAINCTVQIDFFPNSTRAEPQFSSTANLFDYLLSFPAMLRSRALQ